MNARTERVAFVLPLILLFFSGLTAQNVVINEIVASNQTGRTDGRGERSDWIELYNPGMQPAPLAGYRISDVDTLPAKYVLPDDTLAPGAYLVLYASGDTLNPPVGERHLPFRVSSAGEAITLWDAAGRLLDRSPERAIRTDVSLGRAFPDDGQWYFYPFPTPGRVNNTTAYLGEVGPPSFSVEPGFHAGEVILEVFPAAPDDVVRYTLDGSAPRADSPEFPFRLTLTRNTAVRVAGFRDGALPSNPVSGSYLFEAKGSLPTVSLIVDDRRFFGNGGIYALNSSHEEPLSVAYYDTAGNLGFRQRMGVRSHAFDRRRQKSLRLYARARYGKPTVEYPLFDDTDVTSFHRLVLRNGGNDGAEEDRIHIKDGFVHRLYAELDDTYVAAYQPVTVYINGEYWGIYNLRERQDEFYAKDYFGHDCEDLTFLEYDYQEPGFKKTICGDFTEWEQLRACFLSADTTPTCQALYRTIDQEQFADYQILGTFIGNADWLNNNIKFWKANEPGARWRWVLWDTEYGLGTQVNFPVGNPEFDFLGMTMYWGGWGNDDYTWMLRGLLQRDSTFRNYFVTRYSDLLNTTFLPDYLTARLDALAADVSGEMPRQLNRWNSTQARYDEHYDHTTDFLERRGLFARAEIPIRVGVSGRTRRITVDVSDPNAGRVHINTLTIDERTPGWQDQPYPWSGDYFVEMTDTLVAEAYRGYEFVGWEGDTTATTAALLMRRDTNYRVTAVFARQPRADLTTVVINELMADNEQYAVEEAGIFPDWIELYNPDTVALNLAGAYLSDDPQNQQKWQIPFTDSVGTTIPAGGYLVLIADGDTLAGARHLPFRLSRAGEYVSLAFYDQSDNLRTADAIDFPALDADETYGRLPNGGPRWRVVGTVTPGAPNLLPVSTVDPREAFSLKIFPNPTIGTFYVRTPTELGSLEARLTDVTGRTLRTRRLAAGTTEWSVPNLPNGAYLLTVTAGDGARVQRWVLKGQH